MRPGNPQAPASPNAPVAPVAPAKPAALAPPRVLIEPKGPIDPKSVEAAGQVVQLYGALIEERRFNEAGSLWGDRALAASFATHFKVTTHMEIGDLGETDGAAGSIFTTVPVIFYRTGLRRHADVILRRVNDVPGSTAEQRRWHIAQIEWKDAR
ncbi:MAG: hypothetical protein ABIS09_03780 [Sphingomicrobium sp.]